MTFGGGDSPRRVGNASNSDYGAYSRDPKDEKYINLAVAAKADFLVSRDKDLLDLTTDVSIEEKRFRQKSKLLKVAEPIVFLRFCGKKFRVVKREKIMSQETQPIRIETGEEVAFELMKFIAEKENKQLAPEEIRDYYLDLFIECAAVVYDGERLADD